MSSADARFEASDQILIAENRVRISWCGRSYFADTPVDAACEMRQQDRDIEWSEFPDGAYRISKFAKSLLEPFDLSSPVSARRRARQKDTGDPRLRVGRRAIRDGENTVRLEVLG